MLEEGGRKPGSASAFSTGCVNTGVSFRVPPELHRFEGSGQKRHSKPCLQDVSCASSGSLTGEKWCVWLVTRLSWLGTELAAGYFFYSSYVEVYWGK